MLTTHHRDPLSPWNMLLQTEGCCECQIYTRLQRLSTPKKESISSLIICLHELHVYNICDILGLIKCIVKSNSICFFLLFKIRLLKNLKWQMCLPPLWLAWYVYGTMLQGAQHENKWYNDNVVGVARRAMTVTQDTQGAQVQGIRWSV